MNSASHSKKSVHCTYPKRQNVPNAWIPKHFHISCKTYQARCGVMRKRPNEPLYRSPNHHFAAFEKGAKWYWSRKEADRDSGLTRPLICYPPPTQMLLPPPRPRCMAAANCVASVPKSGCVVFHHHTFVVIPTIGAV